MEKQLKLEVGQEMPSQRLRIWRTLLHDNFMGVECRADAEDLHGSITGRLVNAGSISVSSISRQVLTRTPSLIRCEADETAIVALGMGGTFSIEQGGQSAVLDQGDLCVIDASRPFEVQMVSDVVQHEFLHIPKSAITRRLGGMEEAAFGTFGAEQPLQKLVAAFLRGMTASLDEVDAATLNKLLDQSLDLLALMIGDRNRGSVEPSTHRTAMRLRVKSFIRSRLKDPDLRIEDAASALGISSRYVNALLSDEGTSFGRYLLAERLEGARREIMNPRRVNRQVTEIAFDWGFNNTSHFGRTYKDRFGLTPRDAKLAGAVP